MSLYNQLCGIDPLAPVILRALDLDPQKVPRIRDAFLKLNAERGEYELAILTRTGQCRSSFVDEIDALRAHPLFLDEGAYPALDDTYAVFTFSIPESIKAALTEVIKEDRVPPEPGERWRKLMAAMQSKEDTPERRHAMKVGEDMLRPVLDRLGK